MGGSDWGWIERGAFSNVSYDYDVFKTCTIYEDKKLILGDAHTSNVVIWDMELKFTYRETLTLKDIMHTPKISNLFPSFFWIG